MENIFRNISFSFLMITFLMPSFAQAQDWPQDTCTKNIVINSDDLTIDSLKKSDTVFYYVY